MQNSKIKFINMHKKNKIQEIIIEPGKSPGRDGLEELYKARFLIWNLILRNIKTSYRELHLGIIWIYVRPLIYVLIFFYIKQRSNANLQAGIEYNLFVYSGVIFWWYFIDALGASTRSIYKDSSLITKIYYPRIITPIIPIISRFREFAFQLLLIPLGIYYYERFPDEYFFLLPIIILQIMLNAFGIGLASAALSIRTKDIITFQKYIFQVGMFLCPVIYSPNILLGAYRDIYYIINPIVAPMEMFRISIFGLHESRAPLWEWGISWGWTCIFLITGLLLFKAVEKDLADNVL
jgi:lipopolysaccharide transport system permease protein